MRQVNPYVKTCLLFTQDRDCTFSAILPECKQEGKSSSVEQRGAPVLPLLLGVNQVQHHM